MTSIPGIIPVGHFDSKIDFYGKKVLMLVRDPRDVAVSQFFHWRFERNPGRNR